MIGAHRPPTGKTDQPATISAKLTFLGRTPPENAARPTVPPAPALEPLTFASSPLPDLSFHDPPPQQRGPVTRPAYPDEPPPLDAISPPQAPAAPSPFDFDASRQEPPPVRRHSPPARRDDYPPDDYERDDYRRDDYGP